MSSKNLKVTLSPEKAFGTEDLKSEFLKKAGIKTPADRLKITRRSIDARGKKVRVHLEGEVTDLPAKLIDYEFKPGQLDNDGRVIVVGSGPAGLFAAFELIEAGLKPIILERGKDVRSRRRDLVAINRHHDVNPDSNYCFGEGGAGTYSDGKLYTRSKKRGDIRKVLEMLVFHGAREEILFEAHPHIGTNKLPNIITRMRENIIEAGGEVHFGERVTDLLLVEDRITGVATASGNTYEGIGVILATGHSARDIFTLLEEKGIHIESKPFALGLRVEHPQSLIDKLQYGCDPRGPYLPASSYSLVSQTIIEDKKRGVFSFCMCPGGFIVPSATSNGEVVVNGMSPSRRDSKFANSGIVVSVEVDDLVDYQQHGALAGMHFQSYIEQLACKLAGGTQVAPAQRLHDFTIGKESTDLPHSSYVPGTTSVNLQNVLTPEIGSRLVQGFKAFGKKMKGYLSNEAIVVGVESRTSSPVRIPRDRETCEHVQVKGLFPSGEGAGFAGGIVSAALDGQKCARQLVNLYGKKATFKAS